MRNIKKWDRVEIVWLDSVHSNGWEITTDEQQDEESMTHRTIGYFLSETKRSIVVVQSIQEWMNKEKHRVTDARMQIPTCAILTIKKI